MSSAPWPTRFRDLAMRVQEQRFTTERLAESLDRLGLRFLDFEVDQTVQRRFLAMFPDPRAQLDLACWGELEAVYPETFVSMDTLCAAAARANPVHRP